MENGNKIVQISNKHNAIYSDIDLTMKKDKVYDLESIYQSIRNIIMTPKGTRLFLRDFGCDLSGILFELMDNRAKFLAIDAIINSISRWEPRVVVLPGLCDIKMLPDDYTVHLTIAFQITGMTDQNYQFEYNFLRHVIER